MMTSNVDRMEAAALARAGSETLVMRLRNPKLINIAGPVVTVEVGSLLDDALEAADHIEQLERELAEYMDAAEGHLVERMRQLDQLTAEKALADRLYETAELWVPLGLASMRNFRKARGL